MLPSAAYKLNNLAFHTQNQFQFMQFTSIYHDVTTDEIAPSNLSIEDNAVLAQCLDSIITNPDTLEFANRKQVQAGEIESYDGALLGRGDFKNYTSEELRLLCTVLKTAPA